MELGEYFNAMVKKAREDGIENIVAMGSIGDVAVFRPDGDTDVLARMLCVFLTDNPEILKSVTEILKEQGMADNLTWNMMLTSTAQN